MWLDFLGTWHVHRPRLNSMWLCIGYYAKNPIQHKESKRIVIEGCLMFITWVKFCDHGSTLEVARSTFVLEILKVVIEGIGSMVFYSVREIARLVHLNLTTIFTSFPTSPIQGHLQLLIWGLYIGYTPLLRLPI